MTADFSRLIGKGSAGRATERDTMAAAWFGRFGTGEGSAGGGKPPARP